MSSKTKTIGAPVRRDALGRFLVGFKHSLEWRRHISKKMMGREITWKGKTSKSLMGHPGQIGSANYFYGKQLVPWNKGGRFSDVSKRKMSDSHKGKNLSHIHRQKIGLRIKELGIKPPLTKGERHHSWKGGITPLAKKIRKCPQYKEWRSTVFRRDSFTCQLCAHQGYVEADHFPKSFAKIMEENEVKTIQQAYECAVFWDTTNGRTLCEACHGKTKKHP